MKTLKAYRYRLKPNTEQMMQINQHFGSVRFVKNWAIALRSRYYRMFGKSISSRRIQDQLVKGTSNYPKFCAVFTETALSNEKTMSFRH